ncbi:MAG TPA: FkbM family methyltransferase [Planctomycetaceae bacterium]|jgi:FkbM family methyltransferase|nr:FkbM family methyltransferase [Planctomycetaceae bacterium]
MPSTIGKRSANVEPAGSVARPSGQRLSLPLRLLAEMMRSLPTDIRRFDVIWQSLYARIGGGGFTTEEAVDQRWPRGLQQPIRGNHGLRMRLNLQNWSDRRAYFSGRYYQPDITRLLHQLLKPGDQYVDVGANVGMTALLARSRIGPAGKGLAFEPNPSAFARLKDHFEINGITNFQLVPCAVADCESVQQLFVPLDEMLLGTFVPEKAEGTRVEVRTMPADSYVAQLDPSKPTLIKIDVEGYEVQVLRGLQSLLAWPDVMLVIEIADAKLRRAGHSREELHDILASFGLAPHTIHVRASRWRKDLELDPLAGPLPIDEYDALFARPGSAVFRDRVQPALTRTSASG